MNLLVVNDDSIHAPGLALLARAAAAFGNVWVVAPARQCSAMSQKLTIHGALSLEQAKDFPAPVKGAYQVDGTPADCVKAAVQQILEEKPDFVLSGVNNGYNVGYEIAYSGTVGAAFEANLNGIPAIALSSGFNESLGAAEHFLGEILEHFLVPGQTDKEIWNVNFPSVEVSAVKGILWDRPVAPSWLFNTAYEPRRLSPEHMLLDIQGEPLTPICPVPQGTDLDAVFQGYISVSKLKSSVLR